MKSQRYCRPMGNKRGAVPNRAVLWCRGKPGEAEKALKELRAEREQILAAHMKTTYN